MLFRALFRTTIAFAGSLPTLEGVHYLFREKRNRKGTGEGERPGEGLKVRKNFLVRIIDQLMKSVAGRM
jgi:hypothetical protein